MTTSTTISAGADGVGDGSPGVLVERTGDERGDAGDERLAGRRARPGRLPGARPGTTSPTATPVLDTVSPSLTACTMATANIAPPVGTSPYEQHEPGAEQQPDRADAERPDALGQPAADRAEHDERQGEQRDAEVGDPLARVEVVEHDRPQRVERPDHQPHRAAEGDGAGERPDAQQVERQALRAAARPSRRPACAATNGRATSVAAGDHEERGRDAERPDEQRRHGRAGGEAGDVGGEQATEVVAEPVRARR